jgi:beta-lactamase class A
MKFASRIRSLLLVLSALGCVSPAPGQISTSKTPRESPARAEVEKLIQTNGADVAVAFRSLDGKQQLFIQPDREFHAANTIIKIPVMIELYAEAQAGELRLSDPLPVHNGFHSIVDGSIHNLDPKDDSDPDAYKAIGNTRTLRDLCEDMITRNSDLAGNLLIEKLGFDRIHQRIHALNADGVEFRRGFEGDKANDEALDNTTSARGLMELLWAMAKGEAVSPEASQEMIGIIARSTSPEASAAGLPPDTRAARLTAESTGIHHEAMFVYGPHSFVLVMVVRGINPPDTSSVLMAQIAHALAAAIS